MPIKVPTPTQAQIEELRKRFIEKYEKNPPTASFHSADVERVKNADLWCTRFLEMYDLDVDVSFEKLWETCIWRQEFGANDLNENNIRKDYLLHGSVFTRNKDIDGKPLLIFKTKLHTKGTKDMNEIMRVVVYWIERIQRETNLDQMTIFFDMDGTGMSNMDLDFVKRIIETFKLYYPNALNYILVYELAWVLNAVFKVVKNLLPAKALEILKMISKKDINTYIDKNNCLKSWGGNDDYTFLFVPEQKTQIQMSETSLKVNCNEDHNNNNNINNRSADKKVHFANSIPVRWPKDSEPETYHMPQDYNMLRITPNEFLIFSQGESSDAVIDITCVSKTPVMYKIQTTSPEKFRVRPRCGVLKLNQSVSVNILLKAEHRLGDASKDKFLVMCMPAPIGLVDSSTPQHVADVWKEMQMDSNVEIEQHRLCCIYKGSEQNLRNGYGGGGSGGASAAGGHFNSGDLADANDPKSIGNVTELAKHAKKLEKQLRFTQLLQYLTLILLLIMSVAVVYLLRLEMDTGAFHQQSAGSAASTKVPTLHPSSTTQTTTPTTTTADTKHNLRARIPKSMPKIPRFGKQAKK